jgi:DNA-dependent RNA polymerase
MRGAEEPALTLPKGAAVKLRDIAWDSIKEKLPGAMKAREHIQAIAKHLLEPGREPFRARNGKIRSRFWAPPATFMSWVTLTGFPGSNRYRHSKRTRVRLPFLGESPIIADEYTNLVRQDKVRDSAVANFVHSQDACHLLLSVNIGVAAGITNFMTIHDCYATLAPDTLLFAKIRRGALARMYWDNPLDRLWERNVRPDAKDITPLAMGNLEPLAVALSEYPDR